MDYYVFVLLAVMLGLILWWSILIISGLKTQASRADQQDDSLAYTVTDSSSRNHQAHLPCDVSSDAVFTGKGTVIATDSDIVESDIAENKACRMI